MLFGVYNGVEGPTRYLWSPLPIQTDGFVLGFGIMNVHARYIVLILVISRGCGFVVLDELEVVVDVSWRIYSWHHTCNCCVWTRSRPLVYSGHKTIVNPRKIVGLEYSHHFERCVLRSCKLISDWVKIVSKYAKHATLISEAVDWKAMVEGSRR